MLLDKLQRSVTKEAIRLGLADQEYIDFLLGWKGRQSFDAVLLKLSENANLQLDNGDEDDLRTLDRWTEVVQRYRTQAKI